MHQRENTFSQPVITVSYLKIERAD